MRHWVSRHAGMRGVIAICCLALIVIVWAALMVQVEFDRRVTVENAVRQNSNLARAFAEHTVRTIRGIDAAALVVSAVILLMGWLFRGTALGAQGRRRDLGKPDHFRRAQRSG